MSSRPMPSPCHASPITIANSAVAESSGERTNRATAMIGASSSPSRSAKVATSA